MNVVIAGGTGLIGTALCRRLFAAGHEISVLTRNPGRAAELLGPHVNAVQWDGKTPGAWDALIGESDVVVNLAGESIGESRWTSERKELIVNSRLLATRVLVETIIGSTRKPSVFLSASAVGYYGDVPEGECDETAMWGTDFLAELCKKWEAEADRVGVSGVRTVILRSGLVLSTKGGALQKLLPAFRKFVGGPMGSGRQWWPWVHIDDEIEMMMHAIEHDNVIGAYNSTAPNPLRMKEFAQVLGKVLGRPSAMPAPGFALRLLLGEMADTMLLGGQRAIPKKMLDAGYVFKHSDLESALRNLLS